MGEMTVAVCCPTTVGDGNEGDFWRTVSSPETITHRSKSELTKDLILYFKVLEEIAAHGWWLAGSVIANQSLLSLPMRSRKKGGELTTCGQVLSSPPYLQARVCDAAIYRNKGFSFNRKTSSRHSLVCKREQRGVNLPVEAYKEGLVGCKLSSFDDFLIKLYIHSAASSMYV
ncbi:hypothetical protein OPV22_031243 [Ensete ventricosum]|uniref:Uncharacterized protein n=1 Tax=Ensete ventricosum TaxID=4639 RepID=A0AAV8PS93_ENSVE|nr:hypothetical protein OPV22_031243 [Ensete ventricosum]